MTCKHASSGCNYPESECAGFCRTEWKFYNYMANGETTWSKYMPIESVQDPLELSPSEEKAIKTCGFVFIALICVGILSAIYML